jgi:hypothetical protein
VKRVAAVLLVLGGGAVGLLAIPFLAATVVAGELQASAAQVDAAWDVPPAVVADLQSAADGAGVPWFLLAAVASVATDFAQQAPDGINRGASPGTAIFPVVVPPITVAGGGQGMFLVVADAPGTVGQLTDPQDVAAAAQWLARQLATASAGSPLANGALGDPEVAQFWQRVVASAPLDIAFPAPTGPPVVVAAPGTNPIQQFGGAVLSRIGAPTTSSNLGAFSAWAAGEGTCAHFNPLATTQPEPGATPFNTLGDGGHVWNYPSFATGVQATTTAVTNGLYQPVIAAFRADAGVAAVAAAVEQSPWGTRHFGSPNFAGLACSDDGAGASAGSALPPAAPPPATGPAAVAAAIVTRAALYQEIWDQAGPGGG